MNKPIADIRQGRLLYNGIAVFNQINLQIYKGHHWAITGASGSGKTSLLQIIAGNRALNGGHIHYNFDDLPLADPLRPKRQIALVNLRHQFKDSSNSTSFYYQQRYNSADTDAVATVETYLKETAAQDYAGTQQYWHLPRVITELNLQQLLNRRLIQLSNGETRRLLLASALLKNPQLLLLDNPLAGLDVVSRKQFDALFKEIAQSGITLVMTASLQKLPDMITHIAEISEGKILLSEEGQKLTQKPPPAYQNEDIAEIGKLFIKDFSVPSYTWLINMQQVNVVYSTTRVLYNINWQVRPGERWLLSGPNGSGKSTLLSLISGDNPQAYANNIVLFDRKRGSGESIWDIKKNIGFISPELYQYFPTDQGCLQVVESGFYDTLGLYRPAQLTKTATAVQWMKVLGIGAYASKLFKVVPAGVQRLCLLARALVKCPPLLILDEPCQGLDDEQQYNFRQIIDSICAATPVSIIYVTHYEDEMPSCIQHRLQLDEGKVVSIS